MSQMSVGEFASHPKCAVAPLTINRDPLRKNWHGSQRVIWLDCTRALFCASPGGLCNMIPDSSACALNKLTIIFLNSNAPTACQESEMTKVASTLFI